MYAQLYWAGIDKYFELEKSKELDWELIKKSIADVLSEYPDDWNAQKFVYMACIQGDKAQTASLLTFVKESPSIALLGDKVGVMNSCVKWAKGGYSFILRDSHRGDRYFPE